MNEASETAGATIGVEYRDGSYFAYHDRHSEDAEFKAEAFLRFFIPLAQQRQWRVSSYVDVGCGAGRTVELVAKGLRANHFNVATVKGYDVSPHVNDLVSKEVQFIQGDFSKGSDVASLITLFDVMEHVPAPVSFLREISERADIVVLHIPLDDTLGNLSRDRFRRLLNNPGHLVFLDVVGALNLIAMAGIRVVDYRYTFGFLAPSGHRTVLSRALLPVRWFLGKLSPWLLSKTLGGVSLLVVALTIRGLNNGLRPY